MADTFFRMRSIGRRSAHRVGAGHLPAYARYCVKIRRVASQLGVGGVNVSRHRVRSLGPRPPS
jgi:hypothetical protein